MQTRWKVLVATVIVAVPAFMLGSGSPQGEDLWRALWPWDMESAMEPTDAQVPWFMLVAAIEAIGLGLAVSLLLFSWPLASRVTGEHRGLAVGMMASVAWFLGNWWFHDNLHIVNGDNATGLLVIEYAFHVTLIAAAAFMAWAMHRLLQARRLDGPASTGRATRVDA